MSTMGMKIGTKTWSDSAKTDVNPKEVQAMTTEQKQKLGTDDLSALLNRAADKDWVDPSKRNTGHGNANMDKDAFFKLMLTQLKHQDPMNPLKNHEMAAQLAQFSSLEQMTNMNTTLGKIESKSSAPQDFQALNLIGKTVAGDSSRVVRTQFDKEHDFNFELPQDAGEVNVKVFSSQGDEVRNYKLTNLRSGTNKVSWNGKDEGGNMQAAGEYFFQVEAKNSAGNKIPVQTQFKGQITGISFSAEGPVLQVGNQTVKMKDVSQITDSSAKQNDQNLKNSTSLDLKKADGAAQTDITEENTSSEEVPRFAKKGNVMTDVAMSPELMAKLQKEMK